MSEWVTGKYLNEQGIRPKYNKHEWFDKKRKRWTEDIWFCKDCLRDAYWDADYGQRLFPFCPFCGKEKSNGDCLN